MLNIDQIVANQKSAAANLFNLSNTLFDGAQALVQLNLQAAKTTLQEAQATSTAALAAKEPKELAELATTLAQAAPEKAAAYLQHVQAIATASSNEVRSFVESAATSVFDTAQSSAKVATDKAVEAVTAQLEIKA